MRLRNKMAKIIKRDMERKASVNYKNIIKEALEEATGQIENTKSKEVYEFGGIGPDSDEVEGTEYTIEFDVSVDLKNYIQEPIETIVANVEKVINETKKNIELLTDFLNANMEFGPSENHKYNDWVDAQISIDENAILTAKGNAWDFEADHVPTQEELERDYRDARLDEADRLWKERKL